MAIKAIDEIRAGRVLRERDYRWKQANAAKQLIDEMTKDKLAMNAAFNYEHLIPEHLDQFNLSTVNLDFY